jgi:hypothetical protein
MARHCQDVHKEGNPQVGWIRMAVAVRAHVREMPARDLNLIRDGVQSEKRVERHQVELTRISSFCKNLMAGAKFAIVVIPKILPEGLKLTTEILLGFLPVNCAPTVWDQVPRELGTVLERAELGGHSRSRGDHVKCLTFCVPGQR